MATPKFAHIVLQTSRKNELRDWYCTVLDAHVVFENELLTFMTFDDEHHRIALLSPPFPLKDRDASRAGLNHSAFTFDSLGELLERYVALKSKGILPAQPIQHGVTTSLYYRDPDGQFAELQVDNWQTPEDATSYMRGPEYAGDAVGVGFDPEKMMDALAKGVKPSVIQTREWALENCPNMANPIIELSK